MEVMRAQLDLRWMAGGIQAAIEEAGREVERAEAARWKLARIRRLIVWTDAMIDELERENLREVHRVSAAWRSRLALLLSSLPFDFTQPARRLRTPTDVLDVVFAVQQHLFDMKNGRHAAHLRPVGGHRN